MSCDNFLGDIILDVIAMFTSVEGEVVDGIEDVFDSLEGSANVQTLFSVRDFLDGLREFSENANINAAAGEAIDALQELIGETNLSSGLQFMIEIDDNLDNEIRLSAMHQPIGISDVLGYHDRTIVGLGLPASTDHVDLYTCPSNEFSISCLKIATVYSTAAVVRAVDPGSRIFAVGFNDTINGLPSVPTGSYPVVINDCDGQFCF